MRFTQVWTNLKKYEFVVIPVPDLFPIGFIFKFLMRASGWRFIWSLLEEKSIFKK